MHEELKQKVCTANIKLQRRQLAVYDYGCVSGIDRRAGIIAIKPAGASDETLTPDKIVLLDMAGSVVEGTLPAPAQAATHLELYRSFASIGGICHTHSQYATMWAQAGSEIPCLGTTAADYFYGFVPVTDRMPKAEIETDYQQNIAKAIVRRFEKLDHSQMPAVLVASHGAFTWATSIAKAVENAVILELTAKMAFGTVLLNNRAKPLPLELLQKHFIDNNPKNSEAAL
ncbi:MAG: class II aldolase/adducin family protein [Anaerohalosphaeraceae bacterium]|nr:class II aldolase/adducin family protein [Anaerohalosphaeraceae bacterium]